MLMPSTTCIGTYLEGGQMLSVQTKSLSGQDNDSYCIFGQSGYGKTVVAVSILCQKAAQGYSARIIDLHHTSDPQHIYPFLRKPFEQLSSCIDAYTASIPTTLFTPQRYSDNVSESLSDLSYTIAGIFTKILGLRQSTTAALSESIEYTIANRNDRPDIFPAILDALKEFGTRSSKTAAERLAPLLQHNVFRCAEVSYTPGIQIIDLSKYPPPFQRVIAELLLFEEFRTASAQKQSPRYIHIDELQNLSIDKDSYLGKILAEGRKYNLHVILASQSIREFTASERTLLCQTNYKLFFHPTLLEVKYYSELLAAPQHRAEISELLRNLTVGQCIIQGPIYIGEDTKPTYSPICVQIDHPENAVNAALSEKANSL